jgi:hypothetical protein
MSNIAATRILISPDSRLRPVAFYITHRQAETVLQIREFVRRDGQLKPGLSFLYISRTELDDLESALADSIKFIEDLKYSLDRRGRMIKSPKVKGYPELMRFFSDVKRVRPIGFYITSRTNCIIIQLRDFFRSKGTGAMKLGMYHINLSVEELHNMQSRLCDVKAAFDEMVTANIPVTPALCAKPPTIAPMAPVRPAPVSRLLYLKNSSSSKMLLSRPEFEIAKLSTHVDSRCRTDGPPACPAPMDNATQPTSGPAAHASSTPDGPPACPAPMDNATQPTSGPAAHASSTRRRLCLDKPRPVTH